MQAFFQMLQKQYQISDSVIAQMSACYEKVQKPWAKVSEITAANQIKVLAAFQKNQAGDFHLNGSTGYGYGDVGRDVFELIWADVFKAEKALVRASILSGTHAIAIALLGNLKAGDEFVSISGLPYDTLLKVIGKNNEPGTLQAMGVTHKVVDLKNDDFDYEAIVQAVKKGTKMVCIQRSRGYDWRKSLTIAKIAKVVKFVKEIDENIIVFVDNCYGEFVELQEPLEVGADLIAGSLIKNPGGTLAPRGGYVAGRADLVDLAAVRLSAPGIAGDVGSALDFNRLAYQGLFMAPLIVEQALKGAIFAACFLEDMGYKVSPRYDEERADIIQALMLGDAETIRKYCRGIQKASPLDSYVTPYDAPLPGYDDAVIMAGGTFVQGSSIELSVDAPMREPFIAYMQGGISLVHVMTGVALAAGEMEK